MSEALNVIEKLGWPGAIVFFGGIGIFITARFLSKKLFDDDKGIVPKIVKSHLEFVDAVKSSVKTQEDNTERLVALHQEQGKDLKAMRDCMEKSFRRDEMAARPA